MSQKVSVRLSDANWWYLQGIEGAGNMSELINSIIREKANKREVIEEKRTYVKNPAYWGLLKKYTDIVDYPGDEVYTDQGGMSKTDALDMLGIPSNVYDLFDKEDLGVRK